MHTAGDGRRHPAHHSVIDTVNQPIIVFITVCSQDKAPILAKTDVAKTIVTSWKRSESWLVGRYVIMPNHIHFFCSPAKVPIEPIQKWVAYWKSLASREWPRPHEQPIWQRDFWDTQLRQHESYGSKWEYVVNNPVRAGLVKNGEHWPFQGELNPLRW
ncbi:MAG: REP-associated tyrosine transposase [Chthoniobacterales bacterium]